MNDPNTEEYRLLDHHCFRKRDNGFLIDIGAIDGYHNSNTRNFLERGWGGIVVEPNPAEFKNLCVNLAHLSENVDFVDAAIADHGKDSDFWVSPGRGGHSTMVEEKARLEHDVHNFEMSRTRVRTMHVNNLLAMAGRDIDLLDIDAEQMDLRILSAIDFRRFRPEVVMVECRQPDLDYDVTAQVGSLMRSASYEPMFSVGPSATTAWTNKF